MQTLRENKCVFCEGPFNRTRKFPHVHYKALCDGIFVNRCAIGQLGWVVCMVYGERPQSPTRFISHRFVQSIDCVGRPDRNHSNRDDILNFANMLFGYGLLDLAFMHLLSLRMNIFYLNWKAAIPQWGANRNKLTWVGELCEDEGVWCVNRFG